MSLEIVVEGSGIEAALKQLDPRNGDRALMLWFDRGTKYVARELSSRAPRRISGKVKIKTDGYQPPRWARVYVKSPLAHLREGGTGTRAASWVKSGGAYFPSVKGIMRASGLPVAQAIIMARAIENLGGTAPKPFVAPTFAATEQQLVKMAEQAVVEVMR